MEKFGSGINIPDPQYSGEGGDERQGQGHYSPNKIGGLRLVCDLSSEGGDERQGQGRVIPQHSLQPPGAAQN
jgi:hypothetical protein